MWSTVTCYELFFSKKMSVYPCFPDNTRVWSWYYKSYKIVAWDQNTKLDQKNKPNFCICCIRTFHLQEVVTSLLESFMCRECCNYMYTCVKICYIIKVSLFKLINFPMNHLLWLISCCSCKLLCQIVLLVIFFSLLLWPLTLWYTLSSAYCYYIYIVSLKSRCSWRG
jgi:hypothetical protein